jgi:hypothetical protein
MADTLEEILNQTFTVDDFTNNSLTLITTDSSTRYVIKDIYVNTDNAATLENIKLYSRGFYLGNFLYGGSGYEIIGTNGNLTLQSDGLTDYFASAYDLRFFILKDSYTNYYDMTIPYIKNTPLSSLIPSASSSLITTGVTSGQSTNQSAYVIPDLTPGSTAYYFGQTDFNSTTSILFYANVTDTSVTASATDGYRPHVTLPSIPNYIYKANSTDNVGLNYYSFDPNSPGTQLTGRVTPSTGDFAQTVYMGWSSSFPKLYPISDSTGNWNGGGFMRHGGTAGTNHETTSLIRLETATSFRSLHLILNQSNSDFSYWNGSTTVNNLSHTSLNLAGEFETDNVNYFMALANAHGDDNLIYVFKIYFTEVASGNVTSTIPSNVISGYGGAIELVKTINLASNNRLYNSYTQGFIYKNNYYYKGKDLQIRSLNWKTQTITVLTSDISLSGASSAVPTLQIPSQSTMNSRGYNTRTSFDLRITGIKSL